MIAKLVVWGEDRESAIRRLDEALGSVNIVGVKYNAPFAQQILRLPSFRSGVLDTNLIQENIQALLKQQELDKDAILIASVALAGFDEKDELGGIGSSSALARRLVLTYGEKNEITVHLKRQSSNKWEGIIILSDKSKTTSTIEISGANNYIIDGRRINNVGLFQKGNVQDVFYEVRARIPHQIILGSEIYLPQKAIRT